MDYKPLKVGVGQIACSVDTLEVNIAKHLEVIAEARGKGIELLVFPELSITGFPMNAQEVDRLACPIDRGYVAQLAQAARGISVVAGFVEEGPAAQFFNTSVVLGDGKVLYRHRKVNLATYGRLHEGKLFASGRYVETFEIDRSWRGALLICADAWNPALVTLSALHGATLLLLAVNSASWAVSTEFSNPKGWDLACRFYGMIYGMPVIMANRVGTEKDLEFFGGSRVVDPFGEIVARANDHEETLLTCELDYGDVRKARLQLPTVRDSNVALLQREIDRLQHYLGIPEEIRQGDPVDTQTSGQDPG